MGGVAMMCEEATRKTRRRRVVRYTVWSKVGTFSCMELADAVRVLLRWGMSGPVELVENIKGGE